MAKLKYTPFVTPLAIFKRVWIKEPSQPFEGKGKPKYKLHILIPDTEENREWYEEIIARAADEAKKNGVKLRKKFNPAFKFPEDLDDEDFVVPEGKEYAKYDEDYRTHFFVEAKSDYQPGLIDAHRKSLPEDVFPFSGDKGKVKLEPNPYEGVGSGISFYPKTIQLIEKSTAFSGGGADTDGFNDEDGYTGGQTGGNDNRKDDDEDDQF